MLWSMKGARFQSTIFLLSNVKKTLYSEIVVYKVQNDIVLSLYFKQHRSKTEWEWQWSTRKWSELLSLMKSKKNWFVQETWENLTKGLSIQERSQLRKYQRGIWKQGHWHSMVVSVGPPVQIAWHRESALALKHRHTAAKFQQGRQVDERAVILNCPFLEYTPQSQS